MPSENTPALENREPERECRRPAVNTSARGGAKIQSYATHDLADPSPTSQIGFGRICRFVFNLHYLANAALLLCALNAGLSLALTCYGLTIALAYLSLKTTHDRNMRYQSF